MNQPFQRPKTDKEIDLEAARDHYADRSRIRGNALGAFVRWAEEERKAGRFPLPSHLLNQAARALKEVE